MISPEQLYRHVIELEPIARQTMCLPKNVPLRVRVPADATALAFQLIEYQLRRRNILLNWDAWKAPQ